MSIKTILTSIVTILASIEQVNTPLDYECMIGEDQNDPNIPWTVSYRYNGYKGVSSEC